RGLADRWPSAMKPSRRGKDRRQRLAGRATAHLTYGRGPMPALAAVRRRPGIVQNAVSATIPDQRCNVSRRTASVKSSALLRHPAGAPHIDAGEQEKPHHVDEAPVPGGEFEAEMLG